MANLTSKNESNRRRATAKYISSFAMSEWPSAEEAFQAGWEAASVAHEAQRTASNQNDELRQSAQAILRFRAGNSGPDGWVNFEGSDDEWDALQGAAWARLDKAVLSTDETTAPQGESGWLIELSIKGVPHWLMVSSVREWTSDANKAVRFAREGDADAMLFFLGLEDAKATGHEWVAPSPVEPTAVCKRCNGLRFVVSTGQIGVPCPECNAENGKGDA